MAVKELTFLVSVRVPNSLEPRRRTDTLQSPRKEPSSIRPSDTSKYCKMERNFSTYALASAPDRISGSDTISRRGTPVRL